MIDLDVESKYFLLNSDNIDQCYADCRLFSLVWRACGLRVVLFWISSSLPDLGCAHTDGASIGFILIPLNRMALMHDDAALRYPTSSRPIAQWESRSARVVTLPHSNRTRRLRPFRACRHQLESRVAPKTRTRSAAPVHTGCTNGLLKPDPALEGQATTGYRCLKETYETS